MNNQENISFESMGWHESASIKRQKVKGFPHIRYDVLKVKGGDIYTCIINGFGITSVFVPDFLTVYATICKKENLT